MKKHLFTLIISISIINLYSCRKGEHDPFLSLRSRKARLCGEWKVTQEIERDYDSYKPQGYGAPWYIMEKNYIFDGTIKTGTFHYKGLTLLQNSQGEMYGQEYDQTGETTPQNYTESYSFEKNNAFYFNHLSIDNSTINYSGKWAFLPKEDYEKYSLYESLKNKEAILITLTEYSSTNSNGIINPVFPEYFKKKIVFLIDRLTNKQTILNYESKNQSGPTYYNSPYHSSTSKTITLELK